MKYLIAILLGEDMSQKIKQLQQKYKTERWNIRVGPHITLIFRGDLIRSESDLIGRLEAIAQKSQPFEIDFKGIDSFDRQLKVVFAHVESTPELIQLQRDLALGIQSLFIGDDNYSTPTHYRPHVTIANRLTEEETQAVLADMRQHPINHRFTCRNFTLLKRAPKDLTWQEVRTFSFNK